MSSAAEFAHQSIYTKTRFSLTIANKIRCLTSDGDQEARKRRHQYHLPQNLSFHFISSPLLSFYFHLQLNFYKQNSMSYIKWWPEGQEMKASNITCYRSSTNQSISEFHLQLNYSKQNLMSWIRWWLKGQEMKVSNITCHRSSSTNQLTSESHL